MLTGNNIQELISNAYKKIDDQKFDEAKEIFARVLQNEKNNIYALVGLCVCYYQLGVIKEQSFYYDEALALLQKSVENCKLVLEIEPNHKDASEILGANYYTYGCIFVNLNKFEEAIKFLKWSYDLFHDKEIILEVLAEAYYYNEQMVEADETLKKLSSLTGENTSGILNEAKKTKYFKYLTQGDKHSLNNKEKAEEFYQKAINLLPSMEDGYDCLGMCYEHHKMYDKALEIYTKGLKLNPNSSLLSDSIKNLKQK